MNVKLYLLILESRDNPGVLLSQAGFVPGGDPFPGFTGDVRLDVGDVDGNGTGDYVEVAGSGGGPVVNIVSGGHNVFDTAAQPGNQWNLPVGTLYRGGYGDVLFHGLAMPDVDSRIGLDVACLSNGQGSPCTIVFTWLEKGGPVIREWNYATGEEHLFFAADPSYRGGLNLTAGSVRLANMDTFPEQNSDLIVTARPGGAPVVLAFDGEGNQLASFFAGDPASRAGTPPFHPASVGTQIEGSGGEYGIYFDSIDPSIDSTAGYTWSGRLVSVSGPGDPGAQWRSTVPTTTTTPTTATTAV